MSFVVNNRVFVKSDYREEFEQRFKVRASEVDKQPGFVSMRVLRPLGNQAPYVVEIEWEDQAAFRNWVGGDDFKRAHANPLPEEAFNEGGGIEQFDIVVSASR